MILVPQTSRARSRTQSEGQLILRSTLLLNQMPRKIRHTAKKRLAFARSNESVLEAVMPLCSKTYHLFLQCAQAARSDHPIEWVGLLLGYSSQG